MYIIQLIIVTIDDLIVIRGVSLSDYKDYIKYKMYLYTDTITNIDRGVAMSKMDITRYL